MFFPVASCPFEKFKDIYVDCFDIDGVFSPGKALPTIE